MALCRRAVIVLLPMLLGATLSDTWAMIDGALRAERQQVILVQQSQQSQSGHAHSLSPHVSVARHVIKMGLLIAPRGGVKAGQWAGPPEMTSQCKMASHTHQEPSTSNNLPASQPDLQYQLLT
ncbi:hypothetical protein CBL_05520 [Carabus blaptoides fortunei]